MLKVLTIAVLMFCSSSFAASRYFYDVQKLQAILSSKIVEQRLGLSTFDGIELKTIDDARRTILYTVKTGGKCNADVVLVYDDGMNPNYRVISVSPVVCH